MSWYELGWYDRKKIIGTVVKLECLSDMKRFKEASLLGDEVIEEILLLVDAIEDLAHQKLGYYDSKDINLLCAETVNKTRIQKARIKAEFAFDREVERLSTRAIEAAKEAA